MVRCFVRVAGERVQTLDMDEDRTVGELKQVLWESEQGACEPSIQVLMMGCVELHDAATLREAREACALEGERNIHLLALARWPGGEDPERGEQLVSLPSLAEGGNGCDDGEGDGGSSSGNGGGGVVSPAPGAKGVSLEAPIALQLAASVSTVDLRHLLQVRCFPDSAVDGRLTFDAATRTATFVPAAPLAPRSRHTVYVFSNAARRVGGGGGGDGEDGDGAGEGGGREGVAAVPASTRTWRSMFTSWSFRTGELSPIRVLLAPVYLPPSCHQRLPGGRAEGKAGEGGIEAEGESAGCGGAGGGGGQEVVVTGQAQGTPPKLATLSRRSRGLMSELVAVAAARFDVPVQRIGRFLVRDGGQGDGGRSVTHSVAHSVIHCDRDVLRLHELDSIEFEVLPADAPPLRPARVVHKEVASLTHAEYCKEHWVNAEAGFLAVCGKMSAEEETEALLAVVAAYEERENG